MRDPFMTQYVKWRHRAVLGTDGVHILQDVQHAALHQPGENHWLCVWTAAVVSQYLALCQCPGKVQLINMIEIILLIMLIALCLYIK